MPELTDEEIGEFLDADAPNKPEKIEGHRGSKLPSRKLPPGEARRRREVVGELLASGLSNDEIVDALADPSKSGLSGPLSEAAVAMVIQEVRAEWDEEDSERKRYYKAAAVRRISRHIVKAKAAGSWQAVANLEKVLMMIQGTAEPIEVAQEGGTRLSEAVLRVLNEADAREVRRMIESERQVAEQGGRVVKLLPPSGDGKG